jgi:TonB family protein
LSSGFSDRYTVHGATSGREALNTLVETPINVIITAQKLPGMSGLEALREAKKRSPDTIGILLAGSGDSGLEALVGDEEVFQIVRGNVTGDSLLKLVDNATRQMRLMTLAESANDTAANPDEPAEHIIMETSENGSTIISDGTGRMPALNPEKVSAAASVGSKSVDVLVLTKDQEFLTTIKESSRGMHTVHYANTLAQADEMIREHKVGVAVVDAAMVGQKVEQLTQHLRKGSPRLVSIVAGRRDDGEMLMDLINRGKVYRFLLKPVSPGRARLAVEASVKHHMEAPDAAFKMSGTDSNKSAPAPKAVATPAPTAKPTPAERLVPTAKPEPTAKQAPKPAAKPSAAPKPASKQTQAPEPAPAAKLPPIDPPLGDLSIDSPIDKGLSNVFGDKDDTKAPLLQFGRTLFTNPKVVGLATVVVIAIVGAGYWFMSGDDTTTTTPAEPVATTPIPSITEGDGDFGTPVQEDPDTQALVAEARLAREAGQIFNPVGSNAIELYATAVAADPTNAIYTAEMDAVIEQALGMAETALLDSRLDEADAALQRVASVDTDNGRLPFLTAQLWQMQQRNHLADARAAIRDKRFEDAGNALSAAIALNLADTTEIDAVKAELTEARSAQQVDEVLALANARLEEGRLQSPPNDNARAYYSLVLSNDPENTEARQGLNVVASKLVLQARAEIDAGNLDAAEALLEDASNIDSSNSEMLATAAILTDTRDAIVREQRAAQERRRIEEANRLAAAEKAAAEKAAAEQQQAEEAAAQAAAAELAEAETAGDTSDDAATNDTAVAIAAETPAEIIAQEPEPEPAAAVAAQDPAPVSISTLNRTRYVAPKYPRAAQRRNQAGWVDLVFTVTMDGSVKDVEIRSATPAGVFDNAALRAVEKWEFEPVIENGILVEKRAGVRMMFALE